MCQLCEQEQLYALYQARQRAAQRDDVIKSPPVIARKPRSATKPRSETKPAATESNDKP